MCRAIKNNATLKVIFLIKKYIGKIMNQEIANAINTKHLLRIEYHGYYRIVEPHTYGVNKKDHEALSCYQVSGGSSSNETQGWKLLLVHEAHAISMTDSAFLVARNGYMPNTKK
jgi:hypothetical protein